MPQPNTYGQYGFAGYGGFPNQGAGAAGSPVSAAPGMPQPGGAGAGSNVGVGQAAGGADAAAAAGQGGQGQWPAGDPNSYYSNYWGGMSIASLPHRDPNELFTTGYYGQQPGAGQQGAEQQGS